jgi:hypothetical protein
MPTGISPLAEQVQGRTTGIKTRTPWGLLFHTTGSGITAKAVAKKQTPIQVALSVYKAMQAGSEGYPWGGPTYVMDHDGQLYQIANEATQTNHCGAPHRTEYLDGSWLKLASKEMVAKWHTYWAPQYKNPYALFPSKTPNADYIGVEMIPCGDGFGKPMAAGLKFTKAQHDAAILLAQDVAKRNSFPAGWARSPRLLGHEDVQPIDRDDKEGGWDPGFLRLYPYFNFEYVRAGAELARMSVKRTRGKRK